MYDRNMSHYHYAFGPQRQVNIGYHGKNNLVS